MWAMKEQGQLYKKKGRKYIQILGFKDNLEYFKNWR